MSLFEGLTLYTNNRTVTTFKTLNSTYALVNVTNRGGHTTRYIGITKAWGMEWRQVITDQVPVVGEQFYVIVVYVPWKCAGRSEDFKKCIRLLTSTVIEISDEVPFDQSPIAGQDTP